MLIIINPIAITTEKFTLSLKNIDLSFNKEITNPIIKNIPAMGKAVGKKTPIKNEYLPILMEYFLYIKFLIDINLYIIKNFYI